MNKAPKLFSVGKYGGKVAKILRRMLVQYGARPMNQRKVYEWTESFKSERTWVTVKTDLVPSDHRARRNKRIRWVDALIR